MLKARMEHCSQCVACVSESMRTGSLCVLCRRTWESPGADLGPWVLQEQMVDKVDQGIKAGETVRLSVTDGWDCGTVPWGLGRDLFFSISLSITDLSLNIHKPLGRASPCTSRVSLPSCVCVNTKHGLCFLQSRLAIAAIFGSSRCIYFNLKGYFVTCFIYKLFCWKTKSFIYLFVLFNY